MREKLQGAGERHPLLDPAQDLLQHGSQAVIALLLGADLQGAQERQTGHEHHRELIEVEDQAGARDGLPAAPRRGSSQGRGGRGCGRRGRRSCPNRLQRGDRSPRPPACRGGLWGSAWWRAPATACGSFASGSHRAAAAHRCGCWGQAASGRRPGISLVSPARSMGTSCVGPARNPSAGRCRRGTVVGGADS